MSRPLHLQLNFSAAHSDDECSSPSLVSSDSAFRFKHAPVCHICNASFSFTQRRHHCRRCSESVCAGHSMKRVMVEGETVRVCDRCVREELKMKMRLETGDIGFVLIQKLEQLQDERKRQEIERKTKETAILSVQKTANHRITSTQQKLEELDQELTRETDQLTRKKNIVKELKAGLRASREAEEMTKTRLSQLQGKCSALQEEIQANKQDCEQMLETTDHRVVQSQGTIGKSEAQRLLCQSCRSRAGTVGRPAERVASLETFSLKRQEEGCGKGCVLT